jgi:replicative DNA helicase
MCALVLLGQMKRPQASGGVRGDAQLRAANRPIDVVTVEGEIARAGKLEAIGGVAFLGELALRVPTPDNVLDYVRTVQTHARNRAAKVAIAEVLQRAKNWPDDPSDLISELRGELDRGRGSPHPG